MKLINLKKKNDRKKETKAPTTMKQGDSKYCQKCSCESTELFKAPFRKKIIQTTTKKTRKVSFENIMVCAKCFKKLQC